MSSHIPTITECQARLVKRGYSVGKYGVDGLGGRDTQQAILKFQADQHPPLPLTGQFDQATVNALFEPKRVPNPIAKALVTDLFVFVLTQILKGMGINMDLARISKAIAGGLSGAGIGGAGAAYTYISLPPAAQDVLPHWVPVAIPITNMVIGFAVGFLVVYMAPPNKAA